MKNKRLRAFFKPFLTISQLDSFSFNLYNLKTFTRLLFKC